jgi:sarcosine oxidase subunit beta
LPETADAVIVGGGIVGASIAFHLADIGLKDIVLLEKDLFLGSGASAASAGVIYHHLPQKINLRLSQMSLRAVLEFESKFGARIDFRQCGCIQTAGTARGLVELEGIQKELSRLDVRAQMLGPRELTDIFPRLVVDDILGAIFTPDDGYFDPHGMLHGYAARARKLGARILTAVPATGIKTEGGKVTRVTTPHGVVDTGVVINAAGPAAAAVARFAGVDALPVTMRKRQIFITAPTDVIPPDAPFYFDRDPPFYFRPESGGILMSVAEMEECETLDPKLDWSSASILAERAIRRSRQFDSIRIMRGWAGLRSMTPDNTAIIGPLPEPEGFYFAVGFSGHGVMHAPVTGKIIASMIFSGNCDSYEGIALAPLKYERFLA